jgi:hypothetical protein
MANKHAIENRYRAGILFPLFLGFMYGLNFHIPTNPLKLAALIIGGSILAVLFGLSCFKLYQLRKGNS